MRLKKGNVKNILFVCTLCVSLLIGAFVYYHYVRCWPIQKQDTVEGTQGFRVWAGETLHSFTHWGQRMCVPSGWEPVGATSKGEGWATFQFGKTGVIIRSDAFRSVSLSPPHSAYTLTVVYPATTTPEFLAEDLAIISNAFSRSGSVWGETNKPRDKTHTVLITATVAGNTVDDNTRAYPDPGPSLTLIVRTPDQSRAEELLIHAVTHFYNRHRYELISYEKKQAPFSQAVFQEMEATWSETAFIRSNADRLMRLKYLYTVHTAVRTHNFSLIKRPPFNTKSGFDALIPTAMVENGTSFIDDQYGHYVLAPLTMVAIEGLLQKNKTGVSVEKILKDIHAKNTNFSESLSHILPKSDMKLIESWTEGYATIPKELVDLGSAYYDQPVR